MANVITQGAAEMQRQAAVAGRLMGETLVRLHKQAGGSTKKP